MSLHRRKVDIMAGSERMLKAHHKNAVFFKNLENRKLAFDQRCMKNLGKMQQDIYEVYFNEYLPLKGEASKIRQRLPQLPEETSPRSQIEPIPGRGKKAILPDIGSQVSVNKEQTSVVTDTEAYLDMLREKAAARKRQEAEENERRANKLNQANKDTFDARNELQLQSRCSGWPDSVSECSESPPIDEKRLRILKAAIALTSQPVKPPEPRRTRRLRRSFLVQLRRQSKQVWEDEVLQRVFAEKHEKNTEVPQRKTNEGDTLKWRPSLSKNRIFNDDEEDEEDDMEFHFADRMSRTSMASIRSDVSKVSVRKDIPLHDIEEDLYHPESSPELFSVISEERSGSFYTDSSYTTGSDYSYYSSEIDDGQVQ